MKIIKHFLFGKNGKRVNYVETPNKNGIFGTGFPKYLVMHYTAATTAQSAISWFANKQAKASAHLLIARDGSITQFAPFNTITWHAGESQWSGLIGLNKYSIGIELVNAGRLQKTQTNWICSVDKKIIPANEVLIAKHKNENAESAWQTYTDLQLQISIEIAALLLKTYALTDIVGHEDIAPYRKSDPGPAFPMSSFRSKAMGRKETTLNIFTTSTQVNIRAGAGTQFSPVSESLPTGTKVLLLKREGNWSFVEVVQKIHGLNDVEGWVASKFLVQ